MRIQKNIFVKLTIYLLALRSPVIILTILSYLIFKSNIFIKFITKVIPFLILIFLLFVYSLSQGNDLSNIIGQSRDILLCMIIFIFLLTVSNENKENSLLIYAVLKNVLVTIGFIKIIIIVFAAVTGASVKDIISWLRDTWNIQMMSLGVSDSIFFRLQIPLDSVVPFFLFFILRELIHGKIKKVRTWLEVFLLIASMILTLSRGFWAETLLVLAFTLLFELSSVKKVKFFFALILILPSLIFLTPVGDSLGKIISSRFGGSAQVNNVASDNERILQNYYLTKAFFESPSLGHGIGYFIPQMIRSVDTKYLYEIQTMSMLMDIGIIGCMLLLTLILITIIRELIMTRVMKYEFFMFIFFLSMWLFSGSVNPLLFGASGGTMLFLSTKFKDYRFK